MNKIYSIGIGPGHENFLTPQAKQAITESDAIVGYKYYLELISGLIDGKEAYDTGMKKEKERAAKSFLLANEGKTVAVISSGDSGVYGMAALLWEMKAMEQFDTELIVVPGISAMMAAAAKLGAPLGHDFCSVSLSDLLTPWEIIEKRIEAAASGDFVTAVYNPRSIKRFWQLARLREVFLQHRSADTPVGIAHHVGRKEEHIYTTTLEKLDIDIIDMFTVLIIGNSHTYNFSGKMLTPRGYFSKATKSSDNIGRQIMNDSFRAILSKLDTDHYPLDHLWLALHAIHTTADFSIAGLLELSDGAVSKLHQLFYSGKPPVIVTDVNMVTQGIRKSLVQKLGIEVKCYLNDPRTTEIADKKGITRTQAGIGLAVEEHPNALFAFGNAPTALMELVSHIRVHKAEPVGVIAAPVGFVNVRESKWQLKYGCPEIPYIILNGQKGGSNIAATLINAVLSWNDAKNMHPGKGL